MSRLKLGASTVLRGSTGRLLVSCWAAAEHRSAVNGSIEASPCVPTSVSAQPPLASQHEIPSALPKACLPRGSAGLQSLQAHVSTSTSSTIILPPSSSIPSSNVSRPTFSDSSHIIRSTDSIGSCEGTSPRHTPSSDSTSILSTKRTDIFITIRSSCRTELDVDETVQGPGDAGSDNTAAPSQDGNPWPVATADADHDATAAAKPISSDTPPANPMDPDPNRLNPSSDRILLPHQHHKTQPHTQHHHHQRNGLQQNHQLSLHHVFRPHLQLRHNQHHAATNTSAPTLRRFTRRHTAPPRPPRHASYHKITHHPTLRLIASRLREGSTPASRTDGARLGLVVEGGGMRGCVSGAMLMGLLDLGITSVFDAVYGASAGAINATYFLSGQRHGLSIYTEDLTRDAAFLDFRNLWSRGDRPVMNLDFLIDTVMTSVKPLDWHAVLTSPTPLKVVASCLNTLEPALLSDFSDPTELATALKASAAVPHFAGPPVQLRGRPLVDAAVFEPVPVPSAVRDGCTHVFVLCTRPAPSDGSPWSRRVRDTLEVLAKTTILNAPYMRDAWRAAASPRYRGHDEALCAALGSCPDQFKARMGAYVLPLYPEHTAGCHPLCLNPNTLEAACDVGREAVMRLLEPVVWGGGGGLGMEGDWLGVGESESGVFGGAEIYGADMELRYRP